VLPFLPFNARRAWGAVAPTRQADTTGLSPLPPPLARVARRRRLPRRFGPDRYAGRRVIPLSFWPNTITVPSDCQAPCRPALPCLTGETLARWALPVKRGALPLFRLPPATPSARSRPYAGCPSVADNGTLAQSLGACQALPCVVVRHGFPCRRSDTSTVARRLSSGAVVPCLALHRSPSARSRPYAGCPSERSEH
jgi:hypothetical protein